MIENLSTEYNSVISFGNYFKAGEIEYGIHGPEMNGDKLYLSVWHYLEYIGQNTILYDTLQLGRYLTQKSSSYLKCKYQSQNFEINKFDFELLKLEQSNFVKYLK